MFVKAVLDIKSLDPVLRKALSVFGEVCRAIIGCVREKRIYFKSIV